MFNFVPSKASNNMSKELQFLNVGINFVNDVPCKNLKNILVNKSSYIYKNDFFKNRITLVNKKKLR